MQMTIGALAKEAKVNLQTLRYYEKRGLLPPPHRATSGYRLYDEKSLQQLCFIRRAQQFGFSLDEIRDLLKLKLSSAADCHKARKAVAAKAAQVRQRVEYLRHIAETLERLAGKCDKTSRGAPCPVLTLFSKVGSRHGKN